MVDCKHILQHLDEEKKLNEDGEEPENEALEQIAFADRILLNKTDLVSSEEVENIKTRIKSINGVAKMKESCFGKVDLDFILDVRGFDLNRILDFDPEFLQDSDHQHDQSVTSVGFVHKGRMNQDKFETWIRKLLMEQGTDIFRSKGVLYFKGETSKYVFQGVHMLMAGSMEDQITEAEEEIENRIVFIGRNLDRKQLEKGFLSCKA